ncbi:MAG: hypothetical protein ABIO71_12580 [Caldimonas sp.]
MPADVAAVAGQVLAQFHSQVALDDLVMVDVHVHIGCSIPLASAPSLRH